MRTALPRLNGDVLGGRRSPQDLLAAMNAAIPSLESPARGDLDDCRRRLVVLGMIGSSAERHSQEAGSRPGQALAALRVGRWSFRRYVATLASRVGGPPRDSFRSFILWTGRTSTSASPARPRRSPGCPASSRVHPARSRFPTTPASRSSSI